MNLIQTLQEASSHAIGDLKKILSKDARVKQVLQKHLDVDSIQNKTEFLQTLKFFVLNNRNVVQFAEDRDYIKHLSQSALKKLRELKALDMKQSDVDALVDFVSALFREYSHVERAGLSPELRKDLVNWANANGRYFDLNRHQQKELLSVPGLRPTRPTLLYRGLLFNSHDLKERKRYDGSLEVGHGLTFLRSIREGTRIIDLEWDRASSWSTSKETAMQFARFSSANSNFSATMQWLERKGHIDGDLGFVISTLAQPEDILIDMNRLITAAHLKHGNEGEFILAPGSYTCRVSTKMTKAGEVDPVKSGEVDDSITNAVQAAISFDKTWAMPELAEMRADGWNSFDVERLLRAGNTEGFMKLGSKGTREIAIEKYEELRAFYKDHIAALDLGKTETLVADQSIGKIIAWIGNLNKAMNSEHQHKDFKSDSNSRGKVKTRDMTAAQFRESSYSSSHQRLKDATSIGRFTDYSAGNFLNALARGLGATEEKDIHRRGRKDQDAHIDKIIDAFYNKTGLDKPADRADALKHIQSAVLGAERNAIILNTLTHISEGLRAAVKGDAE